MAADHRSAAQALRDAEAQTCVGIGDTDRDMSPFNHREDIASVAPYFQPPIVKQSTQVLAGAVVTFRATPGMTEQWLHRVVDCHLARNASLGFDIPEMRHCPLAVKGARATTSARTNGFAVTIEADESAAAQEILKRAQGLSNPSPNR